jgi:(4-(4-[2-(gamma-L-glutamylamino)ethyl]phenoxymethyl)furan-2-yl)methanamine synthase
MTLSVGWDIGGAHLKAACVEDGLVTRAVLVSCPLWLGVNKLEAAIDKARGIADVTARHWVTMTGELVDTFRSRAEGVAAITKVVSKCLCDGNTMIYAGRAGFVAVGAASSHVADIASANWHASAQWAAREVSGGLFVDMGSTTTDLIALMDGQLVARGYSDSERLASGELVYTGLVRTSLMAVATCVPFGGQSMPLMNEHFASMADVFRILGELPRGADRHPTADGREKTAQASRARLARMLGTDAQDAPEPVWTEVARALKEAQLRRLHDAAVLVLSRCDLPAKAPVIGAGIGTRVVRSVALRLGRPYLPFGQLLPALTQRARHAASDAAPAASVALLAESMRKSRRRNRE